MPAFPSGCSRASTASKRSVSVSTCCRTPYASSTRSGSPTNSRATGLTPTTLAYFTKRGEPIWDEPRGVAAGYRWPQISIHRGELHTILHAAALADIGADRIHTGCHLDRITETADGVEASFIDRRTGNVTATANGSMLIACDGIHSVARRHFYPNEGMPKWNGALLWRGLAEGAPVFDGRTMVWAGHPRQKFVMYPLLDLPDGRQQLNFIAELRTDDTELLQREDWNQPGDLADFLPQFEGWKFPWLDVPALIASAPATFLFPMVDRDPVERWSFGKTTLLGDAAHPMYPIGSNGASQAILDARTLTGCLLSYPGDTELALQRYDEVRRPATSAHRAREPRTRSGAADATRRGTRASGLRSALGCDHA